MFRSRLRAFSAGERNGSKDFIKMLSAILDILRAATNALASIPRTLRWIKTAAEIFLSASLSLAWELSFGTKFDCSDLLFWRKFEAWRPPSLRNILVGEGRSWSFMSSVGWTVLRTGSLCFWESVITSSGWLYTPGLPIRLGAQPIEKKL